MSGVVSKTQDGECGQRDARNGSPLSRACAYRSESLELGSRLTLSEPRASSMCQLERWDAMKGWRGSAAKSRELGRGCRCPPNTGRGTFEIRAAVVPGVGCGSNRGRGVE